MNLNEINNFINVLNLAETKPNTYIVSNNYKYELVKNKNSYRILDAAKIDAISSKVLKTIKYSPQLTAVDKQKLLHSLASGLQNYKSRLVANKPFWSRVGYILGIKTKNERNLNILIMEANNSSKKIKNALPILNNLSQFNAAIKSTIDPIMIQPNTELNLYYKKILDSTPAEAPGGTLTYMRAHPIFSFVQDLKAYESHLKTNGHQVPSSIKQRIKELEFAGTTLMGVEILKQKGALQKWGFQTTFDALEEQIQQQVTSLDSSSLPSSAKPCVLIPGGYIRKIVKNGKPSFAAHGVLYKIERDKNGTYSFTIINTGEGSQTHKKQGRLMATDLKYTGLKREDLSTDFIQFLLSGLDPRTNNCKNFNDVVKKIDQALLKSGNAKKTSGRVHKVQAQGKRSCTSKCVTSFLNEQLDVKTYRTFKVFMTERENKKIKVLIAKPINSPQSLSPKQKRIASAMMAHGEKVLKKRKAKINS